MRVCILDGTQIKDSAQLHDRLAQSLELPQWYGRNLDALYDCLTSLPEETEIQILHKDALYENLAGYASVLERVLQEAAHANPRLRWGISKENE